MFFFSWGLFCSAFFFFFFYEGGDWGVFFLLRAEIDITSATGQDYEHEHGECTCINLLQSCRPACSVCRILRAQCLVCGWVGGYEDFPHCKELQCHEKFFFVWRYVVCVSVWS